MDLTHSDQWDAYLLDMEKVDALRNQGIKLHTMAYGNIIELKVLGPIDVRGTNYYRAKQDFFHNWLKAQTWFPKDTVFTALFPYIYVKNRLDRRLRGAPPLERVFKAAKEAVA